MPFCLNLACGTLSAPTLSCLPPPLPVTCNGNLVLEPWSVLTRSLVDLPTFVRPFALLFPPTFSYLGYVHPALTLVFHNSRYFTWQTDSTTTTQRHNTPTRHFALAFGFPNRHVIVGGCWSQEELEYDTERAVPFFCQQRRGRHTETWHQNPYEPKLRNTQHCSLQPRQSN